FIAAVDGTDRLIEISFAHKHDDHIGRLKVVGHRQVEVIHACTNVVDDRRDFRPSLWVCLIEHEHSDRFVEFAYPPDAPAQLQLRIERDLEEAVPDLLVRKACSFGVAPVADAEVPGIRGATDGPAKRNDDRGDDCSRPSWKELRLAGKGPRPWRP